MFLVIYLIIFFSFILWICVTYHLQPDVTKTGNELSAETSTKIQNGGPKNEREKEEDKEMNSCLGWNQVGTKLQIRLTFYVYVLSRWYVFSIFNLFHLQYDKVLGLSFRDTWHTHITPGLLRLL